MSDIVKKLKSMSKKEIHEWLDYLDGDFQNEKWLRGNVSEFLFYKHLRNNGYNISPSKQNGEPDFLLNGKLKIEHKNVHKDTLKDGTMKLEFQKHRDKLGCPSKRKYDYDWCDVISIDVSRHTGLNNDYRFVLPTDLPHYSYKSKIDGNTYVFENKIKSLTREGSHWYRDFDAILEKLKK